MTEPVQWTTISEQIDRHDLAGLARTLSGLSDAERKPLVALLKAKQDDAPQYGHRGETLNGLTLAGAGLLPSPSALAPWLVRGWFGYWTYADAERRRPVAQQHIVDEIVEVLAARAVPWIPDLVARLAPRLRSNPDPWDTGFGGASLHTVLEGLRASVEADPPTTAGYLVGLLLPPFGVDWYVEKARTDPRFAALAPRFCEFDGVGLKLRQSSERTDRAPEKLAEAAAVGVVDRTALLDAVVGRLQRGGRDGATRGFLQLYEALAPTLDETDVRRRDLLALVAEAPPAVAAVAQEQLVALDLAGRLPRADLIEASQAVFRRTDKKILKAQLAHLAHAVGDDVDDLAAAVAQLFEHSAVDLQRAGVRTLTAWAGRLGDAGRAHVLDAAAALPADLADQLRRALDPVAASVESTVPARPARPSAPAAPSVPGPAAFEPIAELGDLLTEVVALRRPDVERSYDPLAFERVLEAVIRFVQPGTEGRTAVYDALGSSWNGVAGAWWGRRREGWGPDRDGREDDLGLGLAAVIRAATRRTAWVEHPASAGEDPVQGAVIDRLLRLAHEVRERPGALLVSTPSDVRGVITPTDLLDRLRRAASDGWEPWLSDLEQAVLRLDVAAAVGDAGPAAFDALGTDAARGVARWIRSGGPSATTGLRAVHGDGRSWTTYAPREDPPVPVRSRWHATEPHLVASVQADEPGRFGPVWSAAVQLPEPTMSYRRNDQEHDCWAMALPWAPDVVAAHLLPRVCSAVDRPVWHLDVLRLAEAPGPIGDALAAAIAYTMASASLDQRAAAADALVTRAARDDPDGARIGHVLGDLVVGKLVALSRTLEPLQAATKAGAGDYTWAVFRELVGAVVRAQWSITGAADLFAAAAECVAVVGRVDRVDGLSEFAARRGSSRQLVEARRLRDLLGSQAVPREPHAVPRDERGF